MKGIVVEISGKYAIILTQGRSFVKVKAVADMAIGEEIDLNRPVGKTKKTRAITKITSIAAAGLLALGLGYAGYCYTVPYSYIHVDINPSIELTANIYDRIIGVEALNSGGEELLGGSNLKNHRIDTAVKQLINAAVQYGYLDVEWLQAADGEPIADVQQTMDGPDTAYRGQALDKPEQTDREQATEKDASEPSAARSEADADEPQQAPKDQKPADESAITISKLATKNEGTIGNTVLLTVSSNNSRKSNALKDNIVTAATKELEKEKVKSEVLIGEASIEQRDAARRFGVTPGKLVLIEDALESEGESASQIEELKKAPIKDLLRRASDKADEKAKREEERKVEKAKQEEQKAREKAKQEEQKARDKARQEEQKAREKARQEEQKAKDKAKKEKEKAEQEEIRKQSERKEKQVENKNNGVRQNNTGKSFWNDAAQKYRIGEDSQKGGYSDNTSDSSRKDKDNKWNAGNNNKNQGNSKAKDNRNDKNNSKKTQEDLKKERKRLREELLDQMKDWQEQGSWRSSSNKKTSNSRR